MMSEIQVQIMTENKAGYCGDSGSELLRISHFMGVG